MQVTVHYFAQLRRAAGRTAESIDVESGATVAALLARLGALRGEAVRNLLVGADGMPDSTLLVFVGEQPAELSQTLADGDEVTILTPMAGG